MLAKQFWRISHNPQSLLAKALKAQYFPRRSIHECSPKPHHSWFWRNIIKQNNIKLREARWWVGNGVGISLKHPNWIKCPDQNLQNPNPKSGSVANFMTTLEVYGNLIWLEKYIHTLKVLKFWKFPFPGLGVSRINFYGNIQVQGNIRLKMHIVYCWRTIFKTPPFTLGPPKYQQRYGI